MKRAVLALACVAATLVGGPHLATVRAVLSTNLVECWDFEEASGTREGALSAHDFTDSGTVASTAGIIGDAALFADGVVESLSINDHADFQPTGSFTIALWAELAAVDASDGSALNLFTKLDAGNGEFLLLWRSTSDRFEFDAYGASGFGSGHTVQANNLGAVAANTPYLIVAWLDDDTDMLNIQVNNGTADATAHASGIYDGTAQVRIRDNQYANNIPVWVDQVAYFDGKLDATDRTALWNSGAGIDCATVIGGGAAPTPRRFLMLGFGK